MEQFKDCRCGSRIPADWSTCVPCVVQSAVSGDYEVSRRIRRLEANRRVKRGKSMRGILNAPHMQAMNILAARRKMKQNVANRAGEALKAWYNDR